jgi:hypothetical protein
MRSDVYALDDETAELLLAETIDALARGIRQLRHNEPERAWWEVAP